MHTEPYLTTAEEYIARNRAAIAILGAGILAALLIFAWAALLPVLGIVSANLTAAGAIFIALATTVPALGWYWSEA
ncbi:hypothetical protein ACQPUH_15355 [Clostridium perfringens]|uniref:hypothetical protein n=2 Tax=Clostridium TaxID=1485 RepID=UPI001165276F|nr:hypothetical protein SEA_LEEROYJENKINS_5 [Microbacterium phage LeeroyJenkins]QOC59330.1 membrane protein [Microbacterium phage Lifes]USH44461.1 membrane protein [Microbacterium phage Cassita]QDK01525.1 hypothetical protein SEA_LEEROYJENKINS_131 [Microbacterium phage LeeroyJenkins]QOC59445.1 membrane protein [Microbacterium phage Lifes]